MALTDSGFAAGGCKESARDRETAEPHAEERLLNFDPSLPWFHGSPFKLTSLRAGSAITQKIELAHAFSHKPAIVSIFDDGQIKHNGTMPDFLYVVAEEIRKDDVLPYPQTTMAPGDEWLTKRELRVQFFSNPYQLRNRRPRWHFCVLAGTWFTVRFGNRENCARLCSQHCAYSSRFYG